jgi:hypothetical protein
MNLDFRTMDLKPFMELFPATIALSDIDHRVCIHGTTIKIPLAVKTALYPMLRPSYETQNPAKLDSFGPSEQAPLGSIVHARSGDKANNSNVGLFVRHSDEYPWLQSFMTVDRLKLLFGEDWTKGDSNRRAERCEFPAILAVHL